MLIKSEIDNFYAIADMAWSGAVDVCKEIIRQHRENEAMCLIEEMFADTMPKDVQLNDFIWFELGDIMNLWNDNEEE